MGQTLLDIPANQSCLPMHDIESFLWHIYLKLHSIYFLYFSLKKHLIKLEIIHKRILLH